MTKIQYCKILFEALNNFDGVFFQVYSDKLQKHIYFNLDGPCDKPITFLGCFKEMNLESDMLASCKFSLANLKKICTKFDIRCRAFGKSQNEMDLIESEYLIWKRINNYLPDSSFAK